MRPFVGESVSRAEGGEARGYDAGKKITGRKRHLAVDTLGWIWAVVFMGLIGRITTAPVSCFTNSASSVVCGCCLRIAPTASVFQN